MLPLASLVATAASLVMLRVGLKAGMERKNWLMSSERKREMLGDFEGTALCDICYGAIGDCSVAKCGCGKTFHEACARPTGTCPYCGAAFSEMEVRHARIPLCPRCSGQARDGFCRECHISLIRGGMFRCTCGRDVDARRAICGGCGARYKRTSITPRNGAD